MEELMHFNDVWINLQKALQTLLDGGSLRRSVWNDRVLDVYHLCIKPRVKLGERLYNEIQSFLEGYVSQVHEAVYCCDPEDLLATYEYYWTPYRACISYFNHLFSFLNTHVIRKHKSNEVDINFVLYGVGSEDEMTEIGELALDLWRHVMVESQREMLTELLLNEISRDRSGAMVNHKAAKSVIFSLIDLNQFRPEEEDLKLYEEVFEVPFFKVSTLYYIRVSQTWVELYNCSEFMVQVIRFINDEIYRSRKFLHPESYNRVLFDIRQHLLISNIPFLDSNCRNMIQREKWTDLSHMYQLLNPTHLPVENALDTLVSEFEEHLQDIGLAVMQSLQGEDLANQFVQAMLEFLYKYSLQIKNVFGNNLQFLDALDKACIAAINFKRHPRASCRSPELLAKYCDDLLKKGAKGLTESDLDHKLNEVIRLFNYISDKDMFQKFYARGMAKRLIFGHFQSMDLEEAMINRLKNLCGYEYTSKMHRMFTDMTLSEDLNTKFSTFLTAVPDRRLSHNLFINVLAAGSWPISQSDLPTFSLPQELEKCVGMFETFYNEQFCGRKLTWMYNLSLVELKFRYCKRPYLVTMEMYLMGVLLCFNDVDTMTYRDIRDNCQLPNRELLKQLEILVDTKILLSALPITDSSVFTLNLKFSSKRTKFKILPVTPAEIVQEVVQTHIAVEEDRRLFIQATAVRIMKARKEMTHTDLVQEVINQARARFMPKISTIKKCIEMLMEKQYIARAPKAPSSYIYVA